MIIFAHFGLSRYISELNIILLELTTFISFDKINEHWSEITSNTIGPHGPAELIIKIVRFCESIAHNFRQSWPLNLKKHPRLLRQQSKLFIP